MLTPTCAFLRPGLQLQRWAGASSWASFPKALLSLGAEGPSQAQRRPSSRSCPPGHEPHSAGCTSPGVHMHACCPLPRFPPPSFTHTTPCVSGRLRPGRLAPCWVCPFLMRGPVSSCHSGSSLSLSPVSSASRTLRIVSHLAAPAPLSPPNAPLCPRSRPLF